MTLAIPQRQKYLGEVGVVQSAGLNAFGTKDGISLAALVAASTQASTASADQVNPDRAGVKVIVDITAISGAGATLVVTIRGKDPVSGKYWNQLVSAALVAVGTTILTVYPGLPVAANVTASDVLPRTWDIIYTITGATPSITGTIGAVLVG